MPTLDKTGPQGLGPMTGRGWGKCGKGQNFYGQGFGCQRRYLSKSEEINELKENRSYLEEDLKAVQERIAELSAK